MKRLLTFVIALVVIVVAAAAILPSVIPESAYRDRVQEAAGEALGRELTLGGAVGLRLLPRIEVRAEDVRIANAEGFGDAPFAEMAEMRVAIKLIPLLSRRVEIDEFVLVDPVIRLSQRGARNNWTLGRASENAAPAPAQDGGFRLPGALPLDASFGDVRIENGRVEYSDDESARVIDGLNLILRLPSLDEPMRLDGALRADGEAMTFNAELGALRGFFDGAETPLTLRLDGRLIDARFDGRFLESATPDLAGDLRMSTPSLRALAAFAGSELPPGNGLERFEAGGALTTRPDRISLENATVRLDAIRGTGALAVATGGARPRLTGRLELAELNVNPYLPAETAPAPAGGVQAWSEERIDLSVLSLADADLTASAGQLVFRDIEVTSAALRVRIDNGRMQADLERFLLYDGSGSGRVVANARGAQPSFSVTANLAGLQALPFLEAAAGFDRLAGTGAMTLDLSASGANQAAIMRSLSGNGGFNFADGAIRGVNIAQAIRTVQTAITQRTLPQGFGDQEQTDFSSLAGTFTVSGGVATNSDLLMLSPLLRVEGAGQADLGRQTVDYRLNPRAVASIQGQGGDRDLRGITVPIRLRGSFDNVSIGVDTEAVGRALLQQGVTGALSGQRPQDALRDALGLGGQRQSGDEEGEEGEQQQQRTDPAEQLLRGLLGRARQQQQPPAEPEPEPEDGDGG
ncbi:MAG: AsmA family protein [Maricaulaceae bacterium]|nr:AsmA family protein [Maricaulaceae bacterium]